MRSNDDHNPEMPAEVGKTILIVPRAPWQTPRIEILGDLRQLTMGPSPGTGDSANPAIFQAP